jgi:hypothetical protein
MTSKNWWFARAFNGAATGAQRGRNEGRWWKMACPANVQLKASSSDGRHGRWREILVGRRRGREPLVG